MDNILIIRDKINTNKHVTFGELYTYLNYVNILNKQKSIINKPTKGNEIKVTKSKKTSERHKRQKIRQIEEITARKKVN